MPGICTNITSGGGGCGHLTMTVNLDGASKTIKTGVCDPRWNDALDDHEIDVMLRLLARWWKGKGESLSNFVNRVLCGEEGNNVKVYPIITKDITKTNVGTSYVNVPVGANGERKLVNFYGHTQARIRIWANLVGTGAFGFRLIRDGGNNDVLFENPTIALTGERELDSDWFDIPAAFQNEPLGALLRLQIKSATAADDPVVRGCDVGVK